MSKQKTFFVGLSVVIGLIAASNVLAGESTSTPVTEMTYHDTGIGPIQVAPGFGDMNVGPHSNFVRIPGGFVSPPHIHSEDYYAVVVTGVVANGREHGRDIALPTGSYWFQKGDERHVTKCLSATECVFFVTQPGKFDFLFK